MDKSIPLTIAVPKGRLQGVVIELLEKVGIDCRELRSPSRRLIVPVPDTKWRFLLSKPTDVPTYVEYGAADLGVVGKDTLLENGKAVAELVDLGLGRCRLVVAVPEASGIRDVQELDFNSRVATIFPNITTDYFNRQGIQAEVVELNGSVELGPIVGLADAIVDITETGTTLLENGLIPIADVAQVSTRLIANQVSYKVKHGTIHSLVRKLQVVLRAETDTGMEG
ncbi:MAG: ATP phosphoribosyltransferase [Firmicutes bacterium]|nr:ATP phosphoribosyltransferase [Bacillota bacterium]